MAGSSDDLERLAWKAAKQERAAWARENSGSLRKQFHQPALSPALELDLMVPLGNSVAVEYGDMNQIRIQLRKDLRTKSHLDENRAFDSEMTHWLQTQGLLTPGETIANALNRSEPERAP